MGYISLKRFRQSISYKHFFLGIVLLLIAVQALRLLAAILVDPISIWGTPLIDRFNHYKKKQINYLDVFHPYQYLREKPDILYLGTSQVCRGFEPIYPIDLEKKVYTLAPNSLSLTA